MFCQSLLPLESRASFQDVEAQKIHQSLRRLVPQERRDTLPPSDESKRTATVWQRAQSSLFEVWRLAKVRFVSSSRAVVSRAEVSQQTRLESEEGRANQKLFGQIFKQIERDIHPDPKVSKSSPKDPALYTKRQEQLLLEQPDRAIKTAAATVLGQSGAISTTDQRVIGEDTWTDLNLFSGQDQSTLVHHIDRTSSELGRMYLMGLVGCPTKDVEVLRSRQALIRTFAQHEEGNLSLASQISEILGQEIVQFGEKQLLSSWDPKLEYPGGVSKMFYHVKGIEKIANESPLALDAGLIYNHARKILKLGVQAAKSGLLLYTSGRYFTHMGPSPSMNQLTKLALGTSGPAFLAASFIPSPLVTMVLSLYVCSQTALGMEPDVKWMLVDFKIDGILQKKFFAIASFYKAMKEVYIKVKEHPEIADRLTHFHSLKAFFENKELAHIFSVLESRTFNSESSFLFRRGNVLYLLDQLMKSEVKEQFEQALNGFAEIDAFTSAARLFEESQGGRVQFCFPDYVEGCPSPLLELENFWNVFVARQKVVPNSLRFLPDTIDRCHIITGPNGGGKTTVLRSSVGALVLAQSLGIAPASRLRMSPFAFTASSMNVADVQGEKSHFQAECDRMTEVRRRLDALRPDEFGFVVLDELYAGTSHEESSALVRAEVEGIGRRNNVISMVVTHDETLPALAEHDAHYRNFKVIVDPELRPLFRLEEGVSNQHIALKVAERRGVDVQQLKRAQELLDRRATPASIE